MIARRTFIKSASAVAIASSAGEISVGVSEAQQVPNSSGSERSKLKAPVGACDCHHHIYDAARFPPAQPGGTIIPTPASRNTAAGKSAREPPQHCGDTVTHVTDNRDARVTAKLRPMRGVAVKRRLDAEPKALAEGGTAASVSRWRSATAPTSIEMIERCRRINALGWHVQINMTAEQIVAAEDLRRLPTSLVFDHLAHPPLPDGIEHPSHGIVRSLIDKGRTWVKLSVTYDNTKDGPPGYADITKVAQAYIKAAPERMVWGTNWPHPNETKKPDDAALFDLMSKWAPDEATRNRILVQNPETLYGFGKA
jgi:predicted TIM-barrel fold metal-dependent hydrolase